MRLRAVRSPSRGRTGGPSSSCPRPAPLAHSEQRGLSGRGTRASAPRHQKRTIPGTPALRLGPTDPTARRRRRGRARRLSTQAAPPPRVPSHPTMLLPRTGARREQDGRRASAREVQGGESAPPARRSSSRTWKPSGRGGQRPASRRRCVTARGCLPPRPLTRERQGKGQPAGVARDHQHRQGRGAASLPRAYPAPRRIWPASCGYSPASTAASPRRIACTKDAALAIGCASLGMALGGAGAEHPSRTK